VPQVRQHVNAATFQLSGLRILVGVDQVLVHRQRHELINLGFCPCLAEGGQVLAGVAIEHQLVRHQLVGIPGQRLFPGEAVLGNRTGQAVPGEDRVLKV